MLAVNREIERETIEDCSDCTLGSGAYGKVIAWGPSVFKVGAVSQQEADNLNEARRRMGDDTFPAAELLTEKWGDGVMMMDRIGGVTLGKKTQGHHDLQSKILYATQKTLECYGIRHQDLHAGNIIMDGIKVHVVDGGMMDFIELLDQQFIDFWNNAERGWN